MNEAITATGLTAVLHTGVVVVLVAVIALFRWNGAGLRLDRSQDPIATASKQARVCTRVTSFLVAVITGLKADIVLGPVETLDPIATSGFNAVG